MTRRSKAAIAGLSVLAIALLIGPAFNAPAAGQKTGGREAEAILRSLLAENDSFVKASGPDYFKPFLESQQPVATLLCCSDSRVHYHALDSNPDNRLFVVRNIGNQLATAEGSVEYGVRHLHTPVLLILGHVRCGAIKAASGDCSKESPELRRELDSLKVAKGGDVLEGVKANVNDQVRAALSHFASEVKEGKLTVVGAVYDFADDLKQGYGRLVLLNINGETAPSKIMTFVGEGRDNK